MKSTDRREEKREADAAEHQAAQLQIQVLCRILKHRGNTGHFLQVLFNSSDYTINKRLSQDVYINGSLLLDVYINGSLLSALVSSTMAPALTN